MGWVWQTIDDFGASTLDLGLEITSVNGNMRCCVEGRVEVAMVDGGGMVTLGMLWCTVVVGDMVT